MFADPKPPANKLIGMDDRQLASYQVEKLKENQVTHGRKRNSAGRKKGSPSGSRREPALPRPLGHSPEEGSAPPQRCATHFLWP